jgi:hypothetical protein
MMGCRGLLEDTKKSCKHEYLVSIAPRTAMSNHDQIHNVEHVVIRYTHRRVTILDDIRERKRLDGLGARH